jgi:hypothetical protein
VYTYGSTVQTVYTYGSTVQTVYTYGSTVQTGDELVQTTATVSLPQQSLQRSVSDHWPLTVSEGFAIATCMWVT